MNLSTQYLGFNLRSPIVPSASPLTEKLDNIKQMEDSGAGAVVFHSLFEEQITKERWELHHHLTYATESFPEALTFFPEPDEIAVGPEHYLLNIQQAKEAVDIPVIASLNGCSEGGWVQYARQIEEAGADAIELNVYSIPTDMEVDGSRIEEECINILKAVRNEVSIPVAIKLSPYFSNFANMARRLDQAGAHGLVLFNRFYQPDIDLENLEITPNVLLSAPFAMRLPLTWVGILHGKVGASLAATSGIHRSTDIIKMIMAGADVTMLCAILLRRGIKHIQTLEIEVREWMEEHEYESLEDMKGCLSQKNCPDPSAFERAQYMRAITSFDPEDWA